MRKGRNKRKAKQNTVSKPLQSVNINLPGNMSADEMQHIIAHAIVEAEEIKAQKEAEQSETALAEWHAIIGYKKYENKFRNILNEIKVFFKVMFLPKRHIEGDRASTALLKTVISSFFWIMKWCSLGFAVCLFAFIPAQFLIHDVATLPLYQNVIIVLFGTASFIFSRLFRIISIEIDKLDDRNFLFGLFASVTSLVSIIIAVIAIVKGA